MPVWLPAFMLIKVQTQVHSALFSKWQVGGRRSEDGSLEPLLPGCGKLGSFQPLDLGLLLCKSGTRDSKKKGARVEPRAWHVGHCQRRPAFLAPLFLSH